MSRLLETASGYYYPVPQNAIELGLFGPYLEYVGPWPSEEVARLMEQSLKIACEQVAQENERIQRMIEERLEQGG